MLKLKRSEVKMRIPGSTNFFQNVGPKTLKREENYISY